MAFVEEDSNLKAAVYERRIRYTYDDALDQKKGFRFVYEQGAVRCSERLGPYANICRIAPNELNALGGPTLTFVYLDCGRWGGSEYSFGLASGRDVYLCEYVPGEAWSDDQVPTCKNSSIKNLLDQLWALNCGVRILNYARAFSSKPESSSSSEVYVLIPDFHMPPVSWYFDRTVVGVLDPALYRTPPDWFCQTQPYQRNQHLYDGWYGLKSVRTGTSVLQPDIFGNAGVHLVRFLRALSRIGGSLLSSLHVINMGDMTELWLNRPYQFEPTQNLQPYFISGGLKNAADWVAEVMLWNMEVIEAQRVLEQAGLAEVRYLWGNHDAYLMSADLCSQVSSPLRTSSFTGSGGELHVEHGHRFDSSNYDDIKSSDGPFWANVAYYFPTIRKAEPIGRGIVSLVSGSPEERDSYFIGASLLFLHQKFVEGQTPFSIFCMGHTHARLLRIFNITGQYSLWGGVQ